MTDEPFSKRIFFFLFSRPEKLSCCWLKMSGLWSQISPAINNPPRRKLSNKNSTRMKKKGLENFRHHPGT